MNNSTLVTEGEMVIVIRQCTNIPPQYYQQPGMITGITIKGGLKVKFIDGEHWFFDKEAVTKIKNVSKPGRPKGK